MTVTLRGLMARPAAVSDVVAIHELAARVGHAQGQPPVASLADVAADLAWPDLDLQRDTLVGLTDDGAVACSLIASVDKPGRVYVDIMVDPSVDGPVIDGVLDDALAWSLDRAFVECDRLGYSSVILESAGMDGETRLFDAFTRAGLSRTRTYWRMERALVGGPADAAVAPGVAAVDLDDDEDLRRVHRLREQTFAEHHAHVPLTFEEYAVIIRSSSGYDPRSAWIAHDDGVDVGLLLANDSRAEEGRGWISTVGVVKSHRGRGHAQVLLRTAFDHYRAAGMEGVGLMVDAENPTGALRLYQGVGMTVVEQVHTYELVVAVGC